MKRKINCPNCAAPIEQGQTKCPYCGTTYIDLTAIDFDSGEPIFLTIKQNGYLIIQKVLPQTAIFETNSDVTYATDSFGHKLASFVVSRSFDTNVLFTAIPNEHNEIIRIEYED